MQIIFQTVRAQRRDWHVTLQRPSMLWTVKRENDLHVFQYFVSKAEAVGVGIMQAREGHASLVIHGMNGRIQDVKSYDRWCGPTD